MAASLSSSRLALGAGVAVAAYSYWARNRKPVVVIGGGVMGLSTAARLASAGRRVVVIDENHPIRGSWGSTRASHLRIEDPVLLHMGLSSIDQWLHLQDKFQKKHGPDPEESLFYKKTGSIFAGPAASLDAMAAAVRRELGDHPRGGLEVLGHTQAEDRFPQLRLAADEKLMYMPEGYTIVVPTALHCLHWAATQGGVRYEEDSVTSVDRSTKTIKTQGGSTLGYSDLVITSGPWTNRVLQSAGLSGTPMIVSNEQTMEFVPKDQAPSHDWDVFPVFSWSEAGYKGRAKDGGCMYFYTTPHCTLKSSGSQGLKIGFHRQGPLLSNKEFVVTESGLAAKEQLPHLRKELHSEQQYDLDQFSLRKIQDFLRSKMPGLDVDNPVGYMRCLYQMTPDMQMIIGRHPEDASVAFACGFSGSGFQFAPAIADLLCALVTKSELTELQRSMAAKFDPRRFSKV